MMANHEACNVMANCESKEQIFLFHPWTNDDFFLLIIKFHFCYLPEVPSYAELRHNMMMSLKHNNDVIKHPTRSCSSDAWARTSG